MELLCRARRDIVFGGSSRHELFAQQARALQQVGWKLRLLQHRLEIALAARVVEDATAVEDQRSQLDERGAETGGAHESVLHPMQFHPLPGAGCFERSRIA